MSKDKRQKTKDLLNKNNLLNKYYEKTLCNNIDIVFYASFILL